MQLTLNKKFGFSILAIFFFVSVCHIAFAKETEIPPEIHLKAKEELARTPLLNLSGSAETLNIEVEKPSTNRFEEEVKNSEVPDASRPQNNFTSQIPNPDVQKFEQLPYIDPFVPGKSKLVNLSGSQNPKTFSDAKSVGWLVKEVKGPQPLENSV